MQHGWLHIIRLLAAGQLRAIHFSVTHELGHYLVTVADQGTLKTSHCFTLARSLIKCGLGRCGVDALESVVEYATS